MSLTNECFINFSTFSIVTSIYNLPLIWRKRIAELRVLMSGDIFAVGSVRLSPVREEI